MQASIAAGVDLVCFSGDKLLGGPQAGIIAGRTALVDRLRTHPLMRAFRVDKLTFAALEATLLGISSPAAPATTVPVQRMLHLRPRRSRARAQALADRLPRSGWRVALVSGIVRRRRRQRAGRRAADGVAGDREGRQSADATERWLRPLDPPVIARIEHDRVVLDLRTVLPDQDDALRSLLARHRP